MKPAALLLALLPAWAAAQTVCIDPGHPSENAGAPGEVAAVWRVAVQLRPLLEARGYTVVMTKSSEREKVLNRRRAEIANDAKADLLVRLHCDSGGGTGFWVYYPDQKGRAPDGKVGPTPDVIRVSTEAAKRFHAAMAADLAGVWRDNGLRTDRQTNVGGRQGALTGSIYSQVPVVLVEMAVLSNPKDLAFITSKAGSARMARALAAGIAAAVPPRVSHKSVPR